MKDIVLNEWHRWPEEREALEHGGLYWVTYWDPETDVCDTVMAWPDGDDIACDYTWRFYGDDEVIVDTDDDYGYRVKAWAYIKKPKPYEGWREG